MTQLNHLPTKPFHLASLVKRMLLGATIALILIIVFLLQAGEPNPDWPKLWMIRPLIIVPLAGAIGGAFYHFMDYLREDGAWRKVLANFLSLIVFLFTLWIGTVLGLDGTWWN